MYKLTQKRPKISQHSDISVLNLKPVRPFAPEASSVQSSKPQLLDNQQKHRSFGHSLSNISLASSSKPSVPFLQSKLTISTPGDRYEQEADKMATQVVNQINSPSSNHLAKSEMPQQEEEEQIQPSRQSDAATLDPTTELETSIQRSRGGGQPLADNIIQPMEQAFGADFSGVRIHTDSTSDQLNRSIQAKAFTTGQDIFFRQGAYDSASQSGQELIAHELTHVVQQNGSQVQSKEEKKTT